MEPLRVKPVAHTGAEEDIFEEGKEPFETLIEKKKITYVDTDPDVVFFLTGGSEQSAFRAMEVGKFYAMVASVSGNANASAVEVKAALNRQSIDSVLLDIEYPTTRDFLENLYLAKNAISKLEGRRLALIGEVSEWLIASSVKPELLASRLGIQLHRTAWEKLPDFSSLTAPGSFTSLYARGNLQEVEKAGQVYALLRQVIEENAYDAVTVECFSLVKTKRVSGCLALAALNHEGIPAACEGDIVSAVGMMLCKSLTGIIPWMANVAKIDAEKTLLAHCTIDPGLVSDFRINTHFETGVGTAIEGKFSGDTITLFRFNDTLNRAFISTGRIAERPQYPTACRTQIEVKLPEEAVVALREDPLGNHHLILPGDYRALLVLVCRILGVEMVIQGLGSQGSKYPQ